MGAREATAFLLLPLIILGIVFLPPWVYLGAVWVITLLAAREMLALFAKLGHPVPRAPVLVILGATMPAIWYAGLAWSGAIVVGLLMLVPLVYLLGRYPIAGASAGIAGAVFATIYLAVTAGAMGFLRTAFAGTIGVKVLLLHLLTIWGGDTGAYYVGTELGKHKLAPAVSPKKSWEGVVGGTLMTFFGVWFCRSLFFPELAWPVAWLVAALLSVLAPLGDLVESLFKRDAGVKDSSDVIPGHGGFLDRSDSLYYAAPFVLALLLLVGGLG